MVKDLGDETVFSLINQGWGITKICCNKKWKWMLVRTKLLFSLKLNFLTKRLTEKQRELDLI